MILRNSATRSKKPSIKNAKRLLRTRVFLILLPLILSTGCEKIKSTFDIVLDMVGKTKTQLEEKRASLQDSTGKKSTSSLGGTVGEDATSGDSNEQKKVAFYYNPVGKRDPFRSYISIMKEKNTPKNRRQRQLEDTETYELDQYKLTGLVSGTTHPRAMVEDPTGEGHILQIGSRIGKNGGRITRITNVAIIVIEEFRAPTGERVRVPITVKLPQSDMIDPKLTSSMK